MKIAAPMSQNQISFCASKKQTQTHLNTKNAAKYVIPALLMFNSAQIQGSCPSDTLEIRNDTLSTTIVESSNLLASSLSLDFSDETIRQAVTGKTIVLDPGHGGTYKTQTSKSDPYGAKYYDYKEKKWHYEKDMNLESAKKIAKHLEAFGANVVLTRDSDEYVTLERRAEIAVENKADMFVSIHVNGNRTTSVRGLEVYSLPSANEGTKDSKKLAKYINKRFDDLFEDKKSKLKENDYKVLTHTKDIPGALIELGYLSNPTDRKYLLDDGYRENSAQKTSAAILEFFVEKYLPPEATFMAKNGEEQAEDRR